MSKINCKFCNKKFGVRAIIDHIPNCIPNYLNDKSGYLIEFTSNSFITKKTYQMIALFGSNCKFKHIDKFLKNKWCQCCNHISIIDFLDDPDQKPIKFNSFISKYKYNNNFLYCYDMGSTTYIQVRILKKLEGIEKNTNIELLYHNEPHKIKCKCKGNATYIYDYELYCNKCTNDLEEPEFLINLVNSPRTGLCCYGWNINFAIL